eukprot:gene11642-8026_t
MIINRTEVENERNRPRNTKRAKVPAGQEEPKEDDKYTNLQVWSGLLPPTHTHTHHQEQRAESSVCKRSFLGQAPSIRTHTRAPMPERRREGEKERIRATGRTTLEDNSFRGDKRSLGN